MTAQISEVLILNGKKLPLFDEPLDMYFVAFGYPNFSVESTACWRGYQGTWTFENKRLFLIDISGRLEDGEEATMKNIFNADEKIFAGWYSGTLRIPRGDLLKYVHGGYMSVYEEDMFLDIKRGVLVGKRIVKNDPLIENDDFEDATFSKKDKP